MKTKKVQSTSICLAGAAILVAFYIAVAGNNASAQSDDCEFVQDTDRVEKVDTNFYHAKGLVSFMAGFVKPSAFCRSYSADRPTVSRVVAQMLPQIGNPPKLMDIQSGIFTTEPVARSHVTARWEDSYYITVTEQPEGRSLVRVLRTLHVYRGRQRDTKPTSPIPSDGHNEKWLLTQVGDRLAAMPPSERPSSAGGQRETPDTSGAAKSTASSDLEQKLTELQQLRQKNLISEEEYQTHRKQILEGLLKK